MQLKVAKVLNQILLIIFVIVMALIALVIFMIPKMPELKWVFLGSFVLTGIALLTFFRWLEQTWDKRVITRMAQNGKVALANIRSAERIQPMRDSGFVSYWLYEFKGELYDPKLNRIEKKFYEKMNYATQEVPDGSVFVTYDEEKPDLIFIIPNDVVSRIPSLAPIAATFERDKRIEVKYLDVYYDKGINIRTFREAVAEHAKKKQESAKQ
jgi:ABC-type multidrug transport system fused ATPase/permease subunit